MTDFLIDIVKIAFCVFIVNKLMFWHYRKTEKEYYKEVEENIEKTKE